MRVWHGHGVEGKGIGGAHGDCDSGMWMYSVREWRPERGGEEAASQDMRPAAGVDSDRDRSGWGSRPGSQSNRRLDGGRRDSLEADGGTRRLPLGGMQHLQGTTAERRLRMGRGCIAKDHGEGARVGRGSAGMKDLPGEGQGLAAVF